MYSFLRSRAYLPRASVAAKLRISSPKSAISPAAGNVKKVGLSLGIIATNGFDFSRLKRHGTFL